MDRRTALKLGASIAAGMVIAPKAMASKSSSDGKMADSFLEVIRTRRSVRQFRPDPVPEEHLLKIVDAARMAPCADNEQPWKFIIIRDKKVIEAMKNECIEKVQAQLRKSTNLEGDALEKELQKRVDALITGRFSAPAFIVVLTDQQRKWPDYSRHDGPLAAATLLLAARALGYGTVYLTDSIPVEVTKKVLNIPDRYERVCITPVGIPVEWPVKEKKPLEEFIVRESF
jgi:nitroreductase